MARPKGSPKLGGRKKGTPDKVTSQAREAIAHFVEGNVDRLTGWLDEIAAGKVDKNTGKYIIDPDPKSAFASFMSVVEYHIPKLARQEQVGDKDAPVQNVVTVKYLD